MNAIIEGALADALERGRERFNARFAYARRLNRRLNPDSFAYLLADYVKPAVDAVSRVAPDRVDAVTESLFSASLNLLIRDLLGRASRHPEIDATWTRLFPAAARLLAEKPDIAVPALSNAVYHLSSESGARPEQWIDIMGHLIPQVSSVEELLEAGKVAAWRSGMAHYRTAALETIPQLSDKVANTAVGVFEVKRHLPRNRLRLALDFPWRRPGGTNRDTKPALAIVAKVGGFRGFGGPFDKPPEVAVVDGELYAFDDTEAWLITADRFGATFHRAGESSSDGGDQQPSDLKIDGKGKVVNGDMSTTFPTLAGAKSSTVSGDTLAVTLPTSHKVFLISVV